MTKQVDIFSEGSSLQETWAKWENIGDSVQGTYIGYDLTTDPKGNPQNAYHLRQPDGSIISIGVKLTKKKFISLMESIQKGQIIGVKFTKILPAQQKGYSDTKVLEIFANANIRDEKWMSDQAILESMKNNDGGQGVEEAVESEEESHDATPVDEPFSSRPLTDEEKTKRVYAFAEAKLGVTDPLTVQNKVMEATGLAFISSNLDQILEKMRSL